MNTNELVRSEFDKEVTRLFGEKLPEVEKYILNHERKTICIDNLTSEIFKMETMGKPSVSLKKEQIEVLAKSFAASFSKLALTLQEQNHMSEMKKSLARKAVDEANEMETFINENVEEIDRSHDLQGNAI